MWARKELKGVFPLALMEIKQKLIVLKCTWAEK